MTLQPLDADGPRDSVLGERICYIAGLPERLVVGLISGTSHDGVDAALVRLTGHADGVEAELLSFLCAPYGRELRERVAGAAAMRTPELARLDSDLGEAFAGAALAVVERSPFALEDVHLVGSHGQTVYHEPPGSDRPGVTLQLGDPDRIAARTGLLTVSGFRNADVAAGGSGAPLVPVVDWLLFRRAGERQVFLNIGGIANITLVAERPEDVVGFDTGPGNALLDDLLRSATGDPEAVDDGGKLALGGSPDDGAVDAFLLHPYFSKPPPKSTGKELFGREAALRLAGLVHPGRAPETLSSEELADLLATAARLTARSVKDAVDSLPGSASVSRVVVSGGGLRNAAVMSELERCLAPCPVVGSDEAGMDPDAKEAVAFAVLADRTIAGLPGNVPAATGASRSVVLGRISAGI